MDLKWLFVNMALKMCFPYGLKPILVHESPCLAIFSPLFLK